MLKLMRVTTALHNYNTRYYIFPFRIKIMLNFSSPLHIWVSLFFRTAQRLTPFHGKLWFWY